MTKSAEIRHCLDCDHCGWEPDSDYYCGHPIAFERVSSFGASWEAMAREGLCEYPTFVLWEPRQNRT